MITSSLDPTLPVVMVTVTYRKRCPWRRRRGRPDLGARPSVAGSGGRTTDGGRRTSSYPQGTPTDSATLRRRTTTNLFPPHSRSLPYVWVGRLGVGSPSVRPGTSVRVPTLLPKENIFPIPGPTGLSPFRNPSYRKFDKRVGLCVPVCLSFPQVYPGVSGGEGGSSRDDGRRRDFPDPVGTGLDPSRSTGWKGRRGTSGTGGRRTGGGTSSRGCSTGGGGPVDGSRP